MARAYKSEALAAVHEMMEGFHTSSAIDKQTMREFDEGCLTAVEPHEAKVKALEAALIEGEESGEPEPFDNEAFKAEMRAE